MATSVPSLFQRYLVEATCTLPQCLETELAGFKHSNTSFWSLYLGIQRWEAQGLFIGSSRNVIPQNVTRCYGDATTKHSRILKEMIIILKHGTYESKERWIGHPSIPLRVFGPKPYLVTPPIQMTKPKAILKSLPASSSISKLVLKETQSDTGSSKNWTDGWRWCQRIGKDWCCANQSFCAMVSGNPC